MDDNLLDDFFDFVSKKNIIFFLNVELNKTITKKINNNDNRIIWLLSSILWEDLKFNAIIKIKSKHMTSINLSRIIDPKASKVPIGDFIDNAYALPNSPSLNGKILLMKYPIIIDSNKKRNDIV